ncbi:enoyl-CoA hydratase [uncultured Salinicola sp.]|uniref:enoyl-CoA hydratase n=1 Tax=uncultured Salinicola sp. TaxID=1193542 RepID=UPI0026386E17|nr:enoyl-CoA hydratase [uncultured Salinicola sp.]
MTDRHTAPQPGATPQETPRETPSADGLRLEHRGAIAVLTIDNPPANTWHEGSLKALADHLDALAAEPQPPALVITGAGDKFFSAGADLKRFTEGKATALEMATRFGRAFETLSAYPGVTIAAINGYAMGGGLECALACDIRIAERQAQLALPEAKVGLLPCAGGTQHLPWLVGEGWAKRMILCGERIDAERALTIGLVEELVDAGQAFASALELAERSTGQSPQALDRCKRLIMNARDHGLPHGYRMERELFMELFDTAAPGEGIGAFLDKRPPRWREDPTPGAGDDSRDGDQA